MEQVVVGYDGSKESGEALRWAAWEAELRGAEVTVIESWREPIIEERRWYEVWEDLDGARKQAEADLARVTDAMARDHPGTAFSHRLLGGRQADVLAEASRDASLVVVGARGRGGFASLLLGSVSRRLAFSAASPVVVVRGHGDPDGEVVVGVDGRPCGRRALAWAADEARRRGARLHVVMAWSYLLPEDESGPEPFRAEYTAADARIALHAIVRDVLGPEPEVALDYDVPCDLAAKALLERSRGAALLVVGHQDTARPPHLGLGSVTAQVLGHADCPVAVVHGPRPGP